MMAMFLSGCVPSFPCDSISSDVARRTLWTSALQATENCSITHFATPSTSPLMVEGGYIDALQRQQ